MQPLFQEERLMRLIVYMKTFRMTVATQSGRFRWVYVHSTFCALLYIPKYFPGKWELVLLWNEHILQTLLNPLNRM